MPDYTPYIWQQLNDIRRQLGSLATSVEHLSRSLNSTKGEVDSLGELKNKIIGGFIVLGIVFSLASGAVIWTANRVWETVSAIAAPAMREAMIRQVATGTGAPVQTAPPTVQSSPTGGAQSSGRQGGGQQRVPAPTQ